MTRSVRCLFSIFPRAQHTAASSPAMAQSKELDHYKLIFNDVKTRPYNQDLGCPKSSVLNDHLKDRLSGSLVGLAVGDAVGAYFEFKSAEFVRRNAPIGMRSGGTWSLDAGQWTDDTSMALCLAASLLMTGECDPYDQTMRYLAWYERSYLSSKEGDGPAFDIGIGTRGTLDKFSMWQSDLVCKLIKNNSERIEAKYKFEGSVYDAVRKEFPSAGNFAHATTGGNGSLMRLAPIPVFFHSDTQAAITSAEVSSITTHRAGFAIDACKFYAALICEAFRPGATKAVLLDSGFRDKFPGLRNLDRQIVEIAEGSYKTPVNAPPHDIVGNSNGAASKALKAALWAIYNDEDSFKRGVELAVGLGGDTDTVAAIYGQLAGRYTDIQIQESPKNGVTNCTSTILYEILRCILVNDMLSNDNDYFCTDFTSRFFYDNDNLHDFGVT
ncbi:ADP-ribosylarginine hydrolase Tri1-like [Paramacrobiotus metropolitanus]|uniref:ADP-ribosylarginine hydrolase Tri1-like n=1 Tax=Paramacrobiotus metropolitanus TaxID=2943436 RepID=UPI002445686E|nr:ADP-ribosylarginine hydrolase Tri1-like [Paramacrobiotus metropolitanus]